MLYNVSSLFCELSRLAADVLFDGCDGCLTSQVAEPNHTSSGCNSVYSANTVRMWCQAYSPVARKAAYTWPLCFSAAEMCLPDEHMSVTDPDSIAHDSSAWCLGRPIVCNRLGKPIVCKRLGKPIVCKRLAKLIVCKRLGKPIVCKRLGKPIVCKRLCKPIVCNRLGRSADKDTVIISVGVRVESILFSSS